jgi:hypothetical protein
LFQRPVAGGLINHPVTAFATGIHANQTHSQKNKSGNTFTDPADSLKHSLFSFILIIFPHDSGRHIRNALLITPITPHPSIVKIAGGKNLSHDAAEAP